MSSHTDLSPILVYLNFDSFEWLSPGDQVYWLKSLQRSYDQYSAHQYKQGNERNPY